MKTDRAFLDLVQRKIRFENKRRKRVLITSICAVLITTLSLGLLMQRRTSEHNQIYTSPDNEIKTIDVSLMLYSEGISEENNCILADINVSESTNTCDLPVEGKLVVERVSNMSEEEKNNRRAALNESLTHQWLLDKRKYYINGAQSENYIASLAIQGDFVINVKDGNGTRITVECGSNGVIWTEEGSDTMAEGLDTLVFHYDISKKMLENYETNPDTTYADIQDEIICKIESGGKSILLFMIRICFDDNGYMKAEYVKGAEV